MPKPKAHELNDQELATVLAALRHYQVSHSSLNKDIDDIATNGGTMNALTRKQIDHLCERLNQ